MWNDWCKICMSFHWGQRLEKNPLNLFSTIQNDTSGIQTVWPNFSSKFGNVCIFHFLLTTEHYYFTISEIQPGKYPPIPQTVSEFTMRKYGECMKNANIKMLLKFLTYVIKWVAESMWPLHKPFQIELTNLDWKRQIHVPSFSTPLPL